MFGSRTRTVIVGFLILLLTALFLSGCAIDEVSDTIGSCCGWTPLPIAAVGLFFASKGRKQNLD